MKLMWLPILEAVMKYLESLPELSSYQVGPVGGAKSPTGTSGQAGAAGKSLCGEFGTCLGVLCEIRTAGKLR